MECELLRSPMITYQSLLHNTTVLYDNGFTLISAIHIRLACTARRATTKTVNCNYVIMQSRDHFNYVIHFLRGCSSTRASYATVCINDYMYYIINLVLIAIYGAMNQFG